jgi:hypothetical protein
MKFIRHPYNILHSSTTRTIALIEKRQNDNLPTYYT